MIGKSDYIFFKIYQMDQSISAYPKRFYSIIHANCDLPLAYIISNGILMYIIKSVWDVFLIRLFINEIMVEISTDPCGALYIFQYKENESFATDDNEISETIILEYICRMIEENKSQIYILDHPLAGWEGWKLYNLHYN